MDIIIDIETLGTKPGCPIIEIGACALDPAGVIVANFSRRVPHQHLSFAVVKEGSAQSLYDENDFTRTCRWWVDSEERAETLMKILSPSCCVQDNCALYEFCDWLKGQVAGIDPENIRVWANGPAFDISILCWAFDYYGIARPWICWQERCVRTALELAGYVKGSVPWEETGPRHRALCDARHEARKLWRSGALGEVAMIARRLRERKPVA